MKRMKAVMFPRPVICPRCDGSIEVDHPIIDGDDNDTNRFQGTCECGYEYDEDRRESEYDRRESDYMDRHG